MTLSIGLSSAIHGQESTNALAGEWVGNIESDGKSQFTRLSLTEIDGQFSLPLANFTAKFSLVRLEDSRVRFELSSLKLVMTGTLAGNEIDGEAEVPGTKGRFHLVRIKRLAPEIWTSYVGAYRFRNGDFLLIDSFADTPDTLFATDVKSGEVRAMFPKSDTEFIGGPALFVPSPTRQTINFRRAGAHVVGLDFKGAQQPIAYAARIPIRHEEVRFKNGDVKLAGTLLIPESKGQRHPAIVFTHGGGPALRELFWGLGYLFAARGFAVLTYDKRGAGESTGNWREASFENLADDAVAAAKLLQSRRDINPRQIGFWGLSQGGWIAPLAAYRFADSAFVIALSGGGLSPADQELFDTEYELRKAGFASSEINDAITFQRLKNDIIVSKDKWEQYSKARLTAKDQKWFRFPGVDIRGPERIDDPFWANLQRFYVYDPAPTLRALKCPLLAIFGELDTPEAVKANVDAIRQILGPAGQRDYTVKVYPRARHNLMEVPSDQPDEYTRLKRFAPGLFEAMVDWTTRKVHPGAQRRT